MICWLDTRKRYKPGFGTKEFCPWSWCPCPWSWCPLTGCDRLAALLPPCGWVLRPFVWYEGMDIREGIFWPTFEAGPMWLPIAPLEGGGTGPGGGIGWGGGPPWFISGICPWGGIIMLPLCGGPWGVGSTIPGEGILWGWSPCIEWGICEGCTPPRPVYPPASGALKFPVNCWEGCCGGGGGSGAVSVKGR